MACLQVPESEPFWVNDESKGVIAVHPAYLNIPFGKNPSQLVQKLNAYRVCNYEPMYWFPNVLSEETDAIERLIFDFVKKNMEGAKTALEYYYAKFPCPYKGVIDSRMLWKNTQLTEEEFFVKDLRHTMANPQGHFHTVTRFDNQDVDIEIDAKDAEKNYMNMQVIDSWIIDMGRRTYSIATAMEDAYAVLLIALHYAKAFKYFSTPKK